MYELSRAVVGVLVILIQPLSTFRFFFFMCVLSYFFFFSSRRRHTRCLSDWSSDVCSSDLEVKEVIINVLSDGRMKVGDRILDADGLIDHLKQVALVDKNTPVTIRGDRGTRSEERRVGKECRSRSWAAQRKKRQEKERR